MTDRRLIEVAFPLEQTSLDSVHEKNVRHGHISTLHIWPARRPLAACRAALIAALLPDPGTPETRRALCERIGGRVEKVIEKKRGPGARGEEKVVKKTVGGILHWGRETENKADLEFFRQEIRKAFGGRAPRVLDPFAGGGAIPLEAMRLGCDVTAMDINPVAWFILKCTLEYPQRLAGQTRPLPEFVREDRVFMEQFLKAQGFKGAMLRSQLRKLGLDGSPARASKQGSLKDAETGRDLELEVDEHTLEADLAWHVRAWGWWVLHEARRRLARYYPVYADFEPLKGVGEWRRTHPEGARPMTLVPLRDDGTPDVDSLNAEFTDDYLEDDRKPRWVAKPTVAYLWARTVACKNCRATLPLLKTRWLAKKASKRVLLGMEPNAERTGVVFSVDANVPAAGGNNAQRREHDRRLGQGTMSRSGAWCPCCGKPGTVAMKSADLRAWGASNRMGALMTAVVVDTQRGKGYRIPTDFELSDALPDDAAVAAAFSEIPFGLPDEPVPQGGSRRGGGSPFTVHLYGLKTWQRLFTKRQLITLGTLLNLTRDCNASLGDQYESHFRDAILAYLMVALDKTADYSSASCSWHNSGEKMGHTFARFALPILWDYAETSVLSDTTGSYRGAVEWIGRYLEHATQATADASRPTVEAQSAIQPWAGEVDLIVTDPPYYDAIPYADLMDFFYIWLRRCAGGIPDLKERFALPLSPKWDHGAEDGELTDDPSRHGGDATASKLVYEGGMSRAFSACRSSLSENGRLVVVFANKQPDAWETLVAALIKAGFVVIGSWPIQTEMGQRSRALGSSALASSVWLVCKQRSERTRAGWDNLVFDEMRQTIGNKLRSFWDAGIRGPDFVWAATGPALEAYSKHPFVKKANSPGETLSVSEFLSAARRMVVEFVVGRVLSEAAHTDAADRPADHAAALTLDDVTTYYLLHRHDFGMNDAPAGACILYALSCNLTEADLADRHEVLMRTGGVDADGDGQPDEGDADAEGDIQRGSGSSFKLRPWKKRRRSGLGVTPSGDTGRIPHIDMTHHLMHLWMGGDVHKVNDYIDEQGLRRSEVFHQVLQALIELAAEGSDERSVLERISNHLQARGQAPGSLRDVGLGAAASAEQE